MQMLAATRLLARIRLRVFPAILAVYEISESLPKIEISFNSAAARQIVLASGTSAGFGWLWKHVEPSSPASLRAFDTKTTLKVNFIFQMFELHEQGGAARRGGSDRFS